MATKEATIMRIERANERMRKAMTQLKAETDADLKEIELVEKDPLARTAELSEKIADNLEALLAVVVTPEEEEEEKQETTTDDTDQKPTETQKTGVDEAIAENTDNPPLQPGESVPGQAGGLITPDELEAELGEGAKTGDGDDNKGDSSATAGSAAEKPKKRSKAN